MAGYKEPGLQDRLAAAGKARSDALAGLRQKPAIDPEVLAQRAEVARAKEQQQAKAAADRKAKRLEEREAKAAEAALAKAAATVAVPTAAELKAARDARYAARKARK